MPESPTVEGGRSSPLVARRALPRRGDGGRAPAWLIAPAVLTAAAVNLPLVYLVVRSSQNGLERYLEVVVSPGTLALCARTLLLVAGVLATTIAIALPAAWLATRTDLPGRRVWAVLLALPLVFPSYVSAFCLVAALGPRGHLQSWLAPLGVERLPDIAYGYSGALLALGLFQYPYLYLLLAGAFEGLDPALEESSRTLGAGRWRTFARVTLPQLRPALLGGGLLVCLYTLSDFGAVSIVRYDTFTLSIYNAYRSLFDRTVAASLGTVLVALTLAFVAVEALLVRRCRPTRTRSARPAALVVLGRWRWPALAAVALIVAASLALPVAVVASWAWRALAAGAALDAAWGAAARSLAVALITAAAAVALSVPPSVWWVRHRTAAARLIERLTAAGYALPGLVVALALVFFATRWAPRLYQTAPLLVAAYLVRFLPEAIAATRSALQAVSPSFEEAARSLGSGPWRALVTVTLPVIRPGLLAGGGLVFLTTLKELPATLILRPIGFETLATRVWSAAGEAVFSQAALPSVLLLVVSAPLLYLLLIRPSLGERERA
ncbi:MAG TPA: iron ABC transporter permease [Thermoanaerobaculia bacterium]|nr:iron ABC transporter permease [Thermoanaerobaculia bacterium]